MALGLGRCPSRKCPREVRVDISCAHMGPGATPRQNECAGLTHARGTGTNQICHRNNDVAKWRQFKFPVFVFILQ